METRKGAGKNIPLEKKYIIEDIGVIGKQYIIEDIGINVIKAAVEKNDLLVTEAAGFIGFHLTKQLLAKNYHVIGLDNLNDYYDVEAGHFSKSNFYTFL